MSLIKRVYIEITNACNLSCSFCPTSERPKEFMDIEFFEQILDDLVGRTKHIYLHVKGEPTFHPDLIRMIELCNQRDMKVNLTTNGTLIHKWYDQLLESDGLRQISFSLQSFEQQGREELLSYLTTIFEFAKEAKRNKKYVELRLWNLESTQDGENHNKEILTLIKDFFELDVDLKEEVIKDKGIRLKDHLYLSQSAEFTWPSLKHHKISDVGSCYGIKQQIAILVDGTVLPCCLDQEGDIPLGKIKEEKIHDILNSERTIKMKKGFEQCILVEELCQKCGFRERFNHKVA